MIAMATQNAGGGFVLIVLAIVIAAAVLADFLLQAAPAVPVTANTVKLPSNTVILDAPTLVLDCAQPLSRISYAVSNSLGFGLYPITSNLYQNFKNNDYVIEPGRAGTLYYNVTRPIATYVVGSGARSFNVTINNPINISNYPGIYSLQQGNGTQTTGGAGISVYVTPISEVTMPNNTYPVRISIAAASNAARASYLVQLGATCFSPVFLLTVGDKPYNKTFPNNPLDLN